MKTIGRIIWKNKLVDVLVGDDHKPTFEYSRYNTCFASPNTVDGPGFQFRSVSDVTSFDFGPHSYISSVKSRGAFYRSLAGKESQLGVGMRMKPHWDYVRRDFGVLRDAEIVYEHPEMENVLQQLGISAPTLFYNPKSFGLGATQDIVEMEVPKIEGLKEGRTASFMKPIMIGNELYFVEVKGVNCGDEKIDPNELYGADQNCKGGLVREKRDQTVKVLRHLNDRGYKGTLLLAAYSIPEITQGDGRKLGAYLRAVKATPTLAHMSRSLPQVANSLGESLEGLTKKIILQGTEDLARVWKAGVVHRGPLHEQNIRVGTVSDFSGSSLIQRGDEHYLRLDLLSLATSFQQMMRDNFAKLRYPPAELIEKDEDEYERQRIALEEEFHSSLPTQWGRVREIMIGALNKQLAMDMPTNLGLDSASHAIFSNVSKK